MGDKFVDAYNKGCQVDVLVHSMYNNDGTGVEHCGDNGVGGVGSRSKGRVSNRENE